MGRFDGRHLSLLRLGVVVTAVAALVSAAFFDWSWFQDTEEAAETKGWFAAYVDVTTTPELQFENPTSTAARDVVLSFIVASPGKPCTPSWGKDYVLDGAVDDLDRRVARLRQSEGDVVVSFGGEINDELATVCADADRLRNAYGSVIDRYDLRTIDLDLEGAALADPAANRRRAVAIAQLQSARGAKHKDLRVWLTLPASPQGLSAAGVETVASMLAAGVQVSGVNVMTMDFGSSRQASQSMADASIASLKATHKQLSRVYNDAGQPIGPATLWSRMGATPMIGQNDTPNEVFGLDAARQLNEFAHLKGLGRLSMWSLNRDRTCGGNYPDTQVVSTSCSGIDQGSRTYAQTLRGGLAGRPDSTAVTPTEVETAATRATPDDPSSSPYAIWKEDETYLEGTRIVWHHNVYVAKWWSAGDLPDDPTVAEYSSPWLLIGPVLPGEKPIRLPPLPQGTYPEWEVDKVYTRDQRVMFQGAAFSANWWTQGDSPTARTTQADPSPWERLSDAEIRKALAATHH